MNQQFPFRHDLVKMSFFEENMKKDILDDVSLRMREQTSRVTSMVQQNVYHLDERGAAADDGQDQRHHILLFNCLYIRYNASKTNSIVVPRAPWRGA